MRKRALFIIFLLVSVISFTVQPSLACKIIEPIPFPHPVPHPVPPKAIETKEHRVDIAIDNQTVLVQVEAVFHNPNSFQIEGTYFFPLPGDVAVNQFSLFINGKEVKAELLDAQKAREAYQDIVRRMKDPALLEFVGMQMIKIRVFPIMPDSDIKIKLSYNHIVKKDSGMFEFIYPLRSAMPEAEHPIGQVAINVKLHSRIALKNVYSPTHKIDKTFKDDNNMIVGYEGKNILPERDFWLYWSEAENDIGLDLFTYDPEGEDGYFMMMVSPKVEISENEIINKDILFILDKSGSMEENGKIKQAKSALDFCLGKLKDKDRFNIIAFSTTVNFFKEGMIEATGENIERARAFLEKVDANGGTAVDEALTEGLKMLAEAKNLPMILFLTDGLPTVGTTDIEEILKGSRERNKKKVRFFIFGVGYDVNTKLLDRLAEDGRGVCEYVQPSESIEVKVSNLYSKIVNPVLSDIEISYEGVRVYDTYPQKLPDIFKGSQVLILGRYEGKGEHEIRLRGKISGKEKEYVYHLTYGEKKGAEFIANLWAMRKVGYLLDQIRLHGENDELVKEVTRLAKKYGIVTPYTSFLVIEEGAGMSQPQVQESRRMLREMEEKAQLSYKTKATGRMSQEMSIAAGGYRSGALDAMESNGEKFETFLTQDMRDKSIKGITRMKVKHIGSKTFFLKENVWYDSEYEDNLSAKTNLQRRLVEIKFLSDEYFVIINKHPAMAKFLSIGDNLFLYWEGKVYKIIK